MPPRTRSRNASVAQVAACGRSEGSDGHRPLPKRGPHLRKRTPSPQPPRRGRSPGAACVSMHSAGGGGTAELALRSTTPLPRPPPRTPSRHQHKPIDPHRHATTPSAARPTPPVRRPSLLPTPARPTRLHQRRLDGSPTVLNAHQPTPHTLPLPRCRRPALAPPAPAWAHPSRFYLNGRGRGASATRWPPFLESPGGKRKTAGGGAAARSRLRRTPRNEQLETNTKRRTGRSHRAVAFTRGCRTNPDRWLFVVGSYQRLDLAGDQMSPVRYSITARRPYTTSLRTLPTRDCELRQWRSLCATASAHCSSRDDRGPATSPPLCSPQHVHTAAPGIAPSASLIRVQTFMLTTTATISRISSSRKCSARTSWKRWNAESPSVSAARVSASV